MALATGLYIDYQKGNKSWAFFFFWILFKNERRKKLKYKKRVKVLPCRCLAGVVFLSGSLLKTDSHSKHISKEHFLRLNWQVALVFLF